MNYSFKMPVNIYQEEECIRKHKNIFGECGKRAFIVTGKHSAKACGALKDITDVLKDENIEYEIFDNIENNPSLENVTEASLKAKKFKSDFIIGIGGGSPLDASKAISVLAANDIEPLEIFKMNFTKAYPIVAVPTTSGTGSEATPYSVLLRKDLNTKISFGNNYTFAKYALLDPKYTMSLSRSITVNTAVDAFTHSLEGYLSNRATEISDALALEAIRKFGECFKDLVDGNMNMEIREKLIYVSMLGGMVITNTGVTIVHGMGYCYTYFKEIPHGRANGLLVKNYLKYIYDTKKRKIDKVLILLNCRSIDELGGYIEKLLGAAPNLTDEEIDNYTKLTLIQKGSIINTAKKLTEEDIKMLWSNNRI
ncbi:MAG: iron-containing alcohol dehydrogenase family protein [Clostridium butyricum]|jgi:alcohol dehydrogenase class IV|nr:iron-containing alcohol dehydrogenase family protein [Clostridium butyricum]